MDTAENIDATLRPDDTFISEKIEVEVKEGDTAETATIRHLVTAETDKFVGSISGLKDEILGIENQKADIAKQQQSQIEMFNEASIQWQLTISNYSEQIKHLDSLRTEKQALIDKYLPEVEAKIRERQP